jgi:hypothetical protein
MPEYLGNHLQTVTNDGRLFSNINVINKIVLFLIIFYTKKIKIMN